jgi:predicted Rossmann fold nucleotide-binding protein DprA/Smf involved in DNA uptake
MSVREKHEEVAATDGLVGEVMALLRKAYALGRADALREAAAMLHSEANPTMRHRAASEVPEFSISRQLPTERIGRRRRGRPDTMTEERRARAEELLAEGRLSPRKIAQQVGVSPSRMYRWLKEVGAVGKVVGTESAPRGAH